MKYYVNSVEQIVGDEEGTYSEYSKSEKCDDYNTALTKYYKKLSDVAADIGTNHTYMNIAVVTSVGTVLKYDNVGQYVDSQE